MKNGLPNNIKQLLKTFHEQQNSPISITKQSFQLVEKTNYLNAFVNLTPELAKTQAEKSEQRYKNKKNVGALDGVPIAVKDNFCTKGINTTCASNMLRNFVPTYSATVYKKLEDSGAILLGKTNMDQFGMGSGSVDSIFGPTKNPWSETFELDNWRISGGSSGGSAVAVATGACFGALGSDTGGSTRNPAAYCGIVGYKPSYGIVSRFGLIPLVNSMDIPGILTRNIDDCALILNTIAGPDIYDSTTIKEPFEQINLLDGEQLNVKDVVVGIPIEYHCEGLSKEILETWTKVADLLESNGAKVKQVSLPNTAQSIAVYTILNQCEVSSNMARYDGLEYGYRAEDESSTEQLYSKTRAEGFNGVVINRIMAGNYFLLKKNYKVFFQRALKIRRLIAEDFRNVFYGNNKVDILLTPTTLTEAPFYKEFTKSTNRDQCAIQDYCTQPANMSGVPAVSIPIRLSSNGLPLSLQLMARSRCDKQLLSVAKWIEKSVNFNGLQ